MILTESLDKFISNYTSPSSRNREYHFNMSWIYFLTVNMYFFSING